ncbi:MAG: NAD-dependent epimerase/dehydratase family protein [Pseudomonadales bacterium]
MKILLTGATGFIGRELTSFLLQKGYDVTALVRHDPGYDKNIHVHEVIDISLIEPRHLANQEVVIHLAAIAHDFGATANEYERVNVEGTRTLVEAARVTGVSRFIFLSSVKVNGEWSPVPFGPGSPVAPQDDYARTKYEAEKIVREHFESGATVIRVPLVYGPGVKGNFKTLQRLAQLPIPLPFRNVAARRSYLGIDNLCDFIETCLRVGVQSETALYVADPVSLRLPELLSYLAEAMDRRVIQVPLPQPALRFLASMLVGRKRAGKLLNSLEVDLSSTCELLDWQPPYTTRQCLARMFGHST